MTLTSYVNMHGLANQRYNLLVWQLLSCERVTGDGLWNLWWNIEYLLFSNTTNVGAVFC